MEGFHAHGHSLYQYISLCRRDVTPGPRLNIKTVLSAYGDFLYWKECIFILNWDLAHINFET